MNRLTLIFCLLAPFAYSLSPMSACTNFLVGKNASADGSTIISYAADSYTLYGFLHYAPAADHQPGEMRAVKDWDTGRDQGQIPQIAHTYNVVGNTNEHQLTIGETTWGGVSAMWDTVGIDYGSLMYIALERCKTAREAIQTMVALVNEYGYASEGETFSIGDPNEIWMMEMIGRGKNQKGANWVAVRVPDDCIAAHANQARVTTLPLKGAKTKKGITTSKDGNWMWNADIITFAREHQLFEGNDADFNYQAAFAPFDFSGLYVCEARVWSFFRHFSDDMDQYLDYASGKTFLETNGKDCGKRMPLWIQPNHKVSVQEIKDCMRDQYEGTPLDITQGPDAGPWNTKLRYGSLGFQLDSVQYWYERPTATQQTGWSFVSQMRGAESAHAGGIFWFGVDDAATNVYVPMFSSITRIPECFREGNGDMTVFSWTSAWWVFNVVANWAYTKASAMRPEITTHQRKWEDQFNSQIAMIDAKVADMTPEQRTQFLTNYSCLQAQNVTKDWQDLAIYLLVKYIDGQEKKVKNGQFELTPQGMTAYPNRPAYPENYLRTIAPHITHE